MTEDRTTTTEADSTAARKRHHDDEGCDADEKQPRDSKRGGYGNEPLLKLLIPSDVAGAIIGKGGANLIDLKSRYGATIRLSHNKELYPGTSERIVILKGDISGITDLNNYIIDKIHQSSSSEKRGQEIKIIVPNKTAGLIIGKGGAVIKEMKEETQAHIEFTGHHQSPVFGERILTIKGNTEHRIEAARLIISKIASDPDNMANTSLRYSHRSHDDGNGYGGRDERPNEHRTGNFQEDNRNRRGDIGSSNPNSLSNMAEVAQQLVGLAQGQRATASLEQSIKTTVQIQMEIPEIFVGAIMGIQGNMLREVVQFSGAKIEFSRSDLGSTHKLLTIVGDLNQTQIGYHLISQKITQVRNELLTAAALQRR